MELKIFQKGFNYSQDGAGNRLVYHLQGCNLSCPWCANPEGMSPKGALIQSEVKLRDEYCPDGGILQGALIRERCGKCNTYDCLKYYDSGLKLSFECYSQEQLLQEVKNSKLMFFEGGGVTFTGGEATLQFEPLKSVLAALKAMGINTAIETNGTHQRLDELFEFTDHLIMDIKHYDEQKHNSVLGGFFSNIILNIKKAKEFGVDLFLRIPLINGFNAGAEDAWGFAELFKSLGLQNVELLRYHEFGKEKWKKCGMEYTVQDGFVSDDALKKFADILKQNNIKIIHT